MIQYIVLTEKYNPNNSIPISTIIRKQPTLFFRYQLKEKQGVVNNIETIPIFKSRGKFQQTTELYN